MVQWCSWSGQEVVKRWLWGVYLSHQSGYVLSARHDKKKNRAAREQTKTGSKTYNRTAPAAVPKPVASACPQADPPSPRTRHRRSSLLCKLHRPSSPPRRQIPPPTVDALRRESKTL